MDLSIIIVNWNTKELLVDCIKSIISSKPKLKYEIVVVDNGSEDDSVSAIKKLRIKNLSVVENKANLGYSKANNIGIKKAKGEYILLLNSDTKVKKTAIDSLYIFAEKHSDAGAVVPRLLNTDGSVQPSCFRFPTVGGAIQQYFFGRKNLLDKYVPDTADGPERSRRVEVAVMAAFLITPAALKKVGKLDEKYFMYFEDFDYCRRINDVGLKIYYLPNVEVVHIHGASGGKNQLLIDSAKKYHGIVGYYMYTAILWLGQKFGRLLK